MTDEQIVKTMTPNAISETIAAIEMNPTTDAEQQFAALLWETLIKQVGEKNATDLVDNQLTSR